MINLNKHQRLAYENPFIEGQGPPHLPEGWFTHDEMVEGQAVRIGITVSVAAENRPKYGTDAVWEVSVSVWPTSMAERLSHPEDMPIQVDKWTETHKEIAAKTYGKNVAGISVSSEPESAQKEGVVGSGTYALHLLVPLNEEEREGLPVERK